MQEVDWIYRRDDFDLTLLHAAHLMACANLIEAVVIPEASILGGEWTGHIAPETALALEPQIWASALNVLHFKAYKYGQRIEPEDYRYLLARVGRPSMCNSPHVTDEHDPQYWPQADWQATRKDLLHFYLLVRAEYVDLKAKLQACAVSPEALYGMTEAAGKLLDSQMAPPETIEHIKNEILRSWQRVEWSPPEAGPPRSPKRRSRWSKWVARLFTRR